MNISEKQESMKLIEQFQICTQLRYNGRLDIKNSQGKVWSLYYQFGQLVWATGGTHPYRRWMRNINQNFPGIDINKVKNDSTVKSIDFWDYLLLFELYKNNVIQSEQLKKIVVNTIKEILFDIYQQGKSSTFTFERKPEIVLDITILSTSTRMLLKQTQEEWNNWIIAGMSSISPHLSPVVIRPEHLRQAVSAVVYKNFERLMNGNYTLCDLAIKMNQNVLALTRSLVPYIRQGIMELREVPDLPLLFNSLTHNDAGKLKSKSKVPLVACVDDSLHFCKLLEQIITSNGMRFTSIQDPVQALPNLIQKKPDLIFLDLIMPTVNGHELCAQLRCSSIFAKTPIVILTGSDGVFDQARSKVYGATDFINKSVASDKVLVTINKHLGMTLPAEMPVLVG
ncbi:response regulator [Anabaena sphaerica FACHB-251]|uniref:Protein PatA n=1 Tax=Anabaena sphaerica FACHB-251 TaxID=2692883 RepID=A0A926WHJ8_9NOST|nr:response regulator [Anabaena sphaerica]MBD2294690.1 response regulator [Anabaena sphaerica FACHB-251]